MAQVVNIPRKYSYNKGKSSVTSSQPYKSISSTNSMNDRYGKKRISTTEYNCYEDEDMVEDEVTL